MGAAQETGPPLFHAWNLCIKCKAALDFWPVVLRCGVAKYSSTRTQTALSGATQMTVLNTVRQSFQKRMAYLRTKSELRAMPLEVALDLGMFREDASKTAAKAIYG
jgi:uncharacterized protein YjiS (DUF1127 family)